jgi:hypothetical protein
MPIKLPLPICSTIYNTNEKHFSDQMKVVYDHFQVVEHFDHKPLNE